MGNRLVLREIPFLPAALLALLLVLGMLGMGYGHLLPGNWRRWYLIALLLSIHVRTIPGMSELNSLVVGGFAALWVLCLIRDRRARLTMSRLPLLGSLWLAVMLLSATNAGPGSLRLLAVEAKGFLLFLLVLHALDSWSDVRFFVGVFLVFATLSALVGLVQELAFMTTGKLWVGKVDFRTKQLLLQKGGPLSLEVWLRPPAFLGFTQALANVLAVGAAMATALLIAGGRQRYRGWLALGLLLMVATLVATSSKGANGGFFIAALLAVAILRPRWLLPLALAAAIAVLGMAYTDLRFKVEEMAFELPRIGDLAFRMQLAREAFEGSLERHPFLGAGAGRAFFYSPNTLNYEVHNAFLLAVAENGVPGLLVFATLFGFVGIRLGRAVRSVQEPGGRAMLVGLLAGMVALLIHMQSDPFYHIQLTWYFVPLAEAAVLHADEPDRALRGGEPE